MEKRAKRALRVSLSINLAVACGAAFAWNGSVLRGQSSRPPLEIPHVECPVVIDGHLDEPCYQQASRVSDFVVASKPLQHAPPTDVLIFWNAERLVFAFDVVDREVRAAPPSPRESDVDLQDRVEVFLWSGRDRDAYACIEIGAKGAVHDYLGRFYRRFESSWSPRVWSHAVSWSPRGYRVELALPAAELQQLGLTLAAGTRWRLGLFRADFSSAGGNVLPAWVTWVDAGTPEADFHVAEAFGEMVLR